MLNSVWSFWCFCHFRIVSTCIAFCWIKSILLFPDIFRINVPSQKNKDRRKGLLTCQNVCVCCVVTGNHYCSVVPKCEHTGELRARKTTFSRRKKKWSMKKCLPVKLFQNGQKMIHACSLNWIYWDLPEFHHISLHNFIFFLNCVI